VGLVAGGGTPKVSVRRSRVGGRERLQLVDVPHARCVVLSPHLDDAVLSCGDLVRDLAGRRDVVVATLFTEESRPYTWSARAFLAQCASRSSGDALYAQRRDEDAEVLDALGVAWTHAGLPDALFRKMSPVTGLGPVRRLLPELGHVYPTYRLHVTSGRVSRHDRLAVEAVEGLIEALTAQQPTLLVAPLGIGHHVDHVLVRDAAARAGTEVLYYADHPYALSQRPDPGFLTRHDLARVEAPDGRLGKTALVEGYRTQVRALFPDGVPALDEEYYVPARMLHVDP
jgi:LmbE family N-acetylglucosaminyl deacetylase